MNSPRAAAELHSQLQFLSVEGHALAAMDRQALAAATFGRPMETGDLISASWFSPPPPMAAGRTRRAIAEAAVAWCQGANVYFALTPGYDGRFGAEVGALAEAGSWLRDHRPLLAGSEPWPDVGIVMGAPSPSLRAHPSLSQVWDWPVPDDPGAWGESQAIAERLGELGYGSRVLWELDDLARWPADLTRFRALVVPERAALGRSHVRRLREYVRAGGSLLVFGHGTLLERAGTPRRDFALADVLGVGFRGRMALPPEAGPPVCYADSEYGHGWLTRNLADGTPAGWASADTPMPHWAQVNLPVEQPVAKVRVTAREGGYVLRDLDVLTWTGSGWELAGRFEDNAERTVDFRIDPPRTTLGVRVHVRAETYGGQDRNLADIEEIEIYGAEGRLLSDPDPQLVPVRAGDSRLSAEALGDRVAGPVLLAEPRGAELLATVAHPQTGEESPFIALSEADGGRVVWAAAPAYRATRTEWFPEVARLAAGQPGVLVQSEPGRHRLILRRSGTGLLLCLIDTRPDAPPAEARLRLRPEELGLQGQIADVAEGPSARSEVRGGSLYLIVTPDPAAVVLVR